MATKIVLRRYHGLGENDFFTICLKDCYEIELYGNRNDSRSFCQLVKDQTKIEK